jgi:hypothetical protein
LIVVVNVRVVIVVGILHVILQRILLLTRVILLPILVIPLIMEATPSFVIRVAYGRVILDAEEIYAMEFQTIAFVILVQEMLDHAYKER